MTMQPRITSETLDVIDELRDELAAACADQVVSLEEYRLLRAVLARLESTAALADEGVAILVAGVRRGPESPRFRRLLRERDQRRHDDTPAA